MNNQKKKAVKTALLLYPILMGTGGTIMLGVLLLWVIPKDEIPSVALPLSMLGIYIYGTCAISLIVREKFFKGEIQ
ncbi:hypothetical protein [Rossellomorea vietnamensis]|uniref:hypothetical protein n=1 Tax=Rossellomorea vietnamensis TaxID=218284 RepID=UPI000A780F1F|nr:hypothetical protein [Rossellomorea vietnamensis]